jgi:hypothetical protein
VHVPADRRQQDIDIVRSMIVTKYDTANSANARQR